MEFTRFLVFYKYTLEMYNDKTKLYKTTVLFVFLKKRINIFFRQVNSFT